MPTPSFKTNRTIIKCLSILFLFLVSCKDSEETIDPGKDPTSCLLSKAVTSDATLELIYNAEDRPVQIKYDYTSAYKDITSLIEYDNRYNIIRISGLWLCRI